MKNLLLKMVLVLLVAAMPMNVDAAAVGGAVASSGAASSDSDSGGGLITGATVGLIVAVLAIAGIVVVVNRIKSKSDGHFTNSDALGFAATDTLEAENVTVRPLENKASNLAEEIKAVKKDAKLGSPEAAQLEQVARTLESVKELSEDSENRNKQVKVVADAFELDPDLNLKDFFDVAERLANEAKVDPKVRAEVREELESVVSEGEEKAIKEEIENSSLKSDLIDAYLFNANLDGEILKYLEHEVTKDEFAGEKADLVKKFVDEYGKDIADGANFEQVLKELNANPEAQKALTNALYLTEYSRQGQIAEEEIILGYKKQIIDALPKGNKSIENLAVEAMVKAIKEDKDGEFKALQELKDKVGRLEVGEDGKITDADALDVFNKSLGKEVAPHVTAAGMHEGGHPVVEVHPAAGGIGGHEADDGTGVRVGPEFGE